MRKWNRSRIRQIEKKFRATNTHVRRGPALRGEVLKNEDGENVSWPYNPAAAIRSAGSVNMNSSREDGQVRKPEPIPETIGMLVISPTETAPHKAVCVDEVTRGWQSEVRRQGVDRFHRIIIQEGPVYRLSVWFFAAEFFFIEEDHRVQRTRTTHMYRLPHSKGLLQYARWLTFNGTDGSKLHWKEEVQKKGT